MKTASVLATLLLVAGIKLLAQVPAIPPLPAPESSPVAFQAKPEPTAPPAVPMPLPPSVQPVEPFRDPTKAEGPLEVFTRPKMPASGPTYSALPGLSLKGRVVLKDGSAAGLVDIEGRLVLIQKNSILSYRGQTLKVEEFNSQQIRVHVAPNDEIILLR